MAMKKASPKKTEPTPPTPRQSVKTSTKSPAKKASPAVGMGRQAAAKGSKETSAKTLGMAAAYKKTGAGYMKKTYNSASGDLAGKGKMLNAKDDFFAYPVYADNGRTSQRAKDQEKRKKK